MDNKLQTFFPILWLKLKTLSDFYGLDISENNKTLGGAEAVLTFFQLSQVTHSHTVIAVGGGILQDIVSFAAHIFYRGLNLVLIPTTLLAMSDSCVGGKCALNFNGYKNQLGAFHPPKSILVWPGFLETLAQEDIRSGYGEVLKYALLSGVDFYKQVKKDVMENGFNSTDKLAWIYQGLSIKKELVEEDEFDNGSRRLLNYGHTFGHALEKISEYSIPHGVAVAKGIDIVNFLAWRWGWLDQSIFEEIHSFIKEYFSSQIKQAITGELLLKNIGKDKKMQHGKINMIFMENFGKFRTHATKVDSGLLKIVQEYLTIEF